MGRGYGAGKFSVSLDLFRRRHPRIMAQLRCEIAFDLTPRGGDLQSAVDNAVKQIKIAEEWLTPE